MARKKGPRKPSEGGDDGRQLIEEFVARDGTRVRVYEQAAPWTKERVEAWERVMANILDMPVADEPKRE